MKTSKREYLEKFKNAMNLRRNVRLTAWYDCTTLYRAEQEPLALDNMRDHGLLR